MIDNTHTSHWKANKRRNQQRITPPSLARRIATLMATEDNNEEVPDGVYPLTDEWNADGDGTPERVEATLHDGEVYCGHGLVGRMQQLKRDVGEQVIKYVRKIHNGLGHPSAKVLTQTLENAQARSDIIKCAARYECAVCESRKPPATAVKSGPPPSHRVQRTGADGCVLRARRKRKDSDLAHG